MRGLGLLRAARQAAAVAEPLGCGLASDACGSSGPSASLRQLTSLLSLRGAPLQRQQAAGFAAARHRGDDDEEAEALGKLSHSERRMLFERQLQRKQQEEEEFEEASAAAKRHQRILGLLQNEGSGGQGAAASQFVSSFFGEQQPGAAAAAAAGADGDEEGEDLDELALPEDEFFEGEEEEEEEEEGLQVSTPGALDKGEEFDLMSRLQGLRTGSRRIILDKLLRGGIMRADPSAMAEWQEIQQQFRPPDGFRMKVVDVNRTCKGTRTGGLYRYSCMVVVGNGNGVLGWGQGKAAEVNEAVQKAYLRACRNLFPVPRFNGHTIPETAKSKYGQVKLVLYPKASGNGITANPLMYEICKMAGLHDVGIKVHGSRNVRNAVKCLFQAFDRMKGEEERAEDAAERGTYVVGMPPGRYRVPGGVQRSAARAARDR